MMIPFYDENLYGGGYSPIGGQGKLSLDDPARKYLPYIPYDERVTIRN
ncbi:hypothetical protein LEP1GSC169_3506 [Leptospira santarosai str. HAI1349]|nr:hypothetical protein LEP1GSC169_3506 [Leptospira santarosai str. HAI1349]